MKNKIRYIAFSMLFISVIFVNAQTTDDLRVVLDAQINNSVIDIPKGTYILDLKNGKGAYLFYNKKNVQINGNGSTIICNYQKQAFAFENCENVVFSNLIIEYDPPCSTQGTIVAMSSDAKTLDVEIHDGWPMPNPATIQNRVVFYDKNTREMIWNLYANQINDPIQSLGGRTVRLILAMPKSNTYKVGDFIVLNNIPTGYLGHCLTMNYCKNMTMDRVTIYDSPTFHFTDSNCENTYYYRCVIDRKLNDPKYLQDRLRPGIADGIHSLHAKIGPKIEECTLRYLTDDPIAIHGNFYPVSKIDNTRYQLYFITRDYSFNDVSVKQGENVSIITNNGVVRGTAQPTYVSSSTPPTTTEINTCLSYFNDIKDKRYINTIMVRFSAEDWAKMGTIQLGDVVCPNERIGGGFEVVNNTIGHVLGRGMMIKASNGKIQKNTLTYTGAGPIIVAPEFNWMEGGLSSNLDISENYIETCMWRQNLNRSQCAAITVVLESANGDLSPAGGFTNIAIHRNTIKDCPKPCVFLNAIDGGYYYQNIIQPATWARDHGANFLIPNNKEYYTKNVKNIITDKDPLLSGINEVTGLGDMIQIDSNGRVSLNGFQNEKAEMKIYDMMGKLIAEDSFYFSSTVSMNDLRKDIYIISVVCGNQHFTKKYSPSKLFVIN